jgi:hypothetical protein
MAIFQLQAKDTVLRINQYDALNCVQNFNWDGALNNENQEQLGSANYTDQSITPSVSGSFEVIASGSTSTFLSRMIYALDDATGEFMGPIGDLNSTLIRETDLERAVFELVESKKANEVFDRSTLFPRVFLSSLTMTINTDGKATDQYNFEGDLLEVYRKPQHDLVPIPVTRATGGAASTTVIVPTTYMVEGTSVIAGASHKIKYLLIDNVKVAAADLVVTSDVAGDKVELSPATISAGVTIPLGARLTLVAYRKTPGAYPTITYPTTARFVKADHADIWVIDPTATFTVSSNTGTVEELLALGVDLNLIPFTDAQLLLRAQSLAITVPLNRTELKEIRRNDRGNSTYYRAAEYPLPITVDYTAFETDLDDWAKYQKKNAYGSATPDVLNLADFEGTTWMVVRRDYKQSTVLQTVAVLDAAVSSIGNSIQVRNRAALPWKLTGSKIAIQGKTGV